MNILYEVAKAIHQEYSAHHPQPSWQDLSESSIEAWMMVADAAITTYRNCTER